MSPHSLSLDYSTECSGAGLRQGLEMGLDINTWQARAAKPLGSEGDHVSLTGIQGSSLT